MQTLAANYIFLGAGKELQNAAICIDDHGVLLDILPEFKEAAHISFFDGILCPGMINAHCHMELSGMKAKISSGLGLSHFVKDVVRLRQTEVIHQDSAIKYDKHNYSAGIDAIGDICNLSDSAAWKQHSHIRYHNFVEAVGSRDNATALNWNKSCEVLAQMASAGLTASITPHALYSMSNELFANSLLSGFQAGLISIHFRESPDEELMFEAISNQNYLDYFIEQLSKIPESLRHSAHLLLVHCTYAQLPEIELIKKYVPHTYIVLCPQSNLYIENRLPAIDVLARSGAKYCIGTDSLASNSNLNLLDEILCIHHAYPSISFFDILQWACANGAECLKQQELGIWKIGEPINVCHISGLNLHTFRPQDRAYSKRI